MAPRDGTSFDSQLELKQASRNWSEPHNQGRNISSVESRMDDDLEGHQNDSINVTKSYDVSTV